MNTIIALGLVLLGCVCFIVCGAFLLMHAHPVAGGWLVAVGIIRFCMISIGDDDE